ncbi:MAG: MMPL family transporter, partial [Miltoncostaeaceae bacterium]
MQRLVNLTSRRSWLVVGVAVAFLLVSVVVGGSLSSQLNAGGFVDPDTEAFAVSERLEDLTGVTPEASVIALIETGQPIRSAAGIARIEEVQAKLDADEDVAAVQTALEPGGEALVSTDGTDTYLIASFRPIGDDAADEAAGRIVDEFEGEEDVLIGGTTTTFQQASEIIAKDLTRAELIAFPIILLLSLWVFRGLIAALMPVLVGVFTIFGSFLVIGLINHATTISIFALNLIIGLGLGLSIDYSLLIVSRYREEIAAQGPGVNALLTTLRTAGKSVVFSAITVAAALAGLMVFPQNFLFSMGIGGVVAAAVALVTSVV